MTKPLPATRLDTQSGFTLVEMLVALVIFALLASAGVGLLRTSVDTQAIVETRLADLNAVERLRLVLASDLGQATDRPTRGNDGTAAPAFVGAGDRFLLVRGGRDNLDQSPRPSLQRVAWQVDGGRLVRTGFAALDGANKGEDAVLATDLEGARLRYRGLDGGWRADWPGAVTDPPLPRAVELSVRRRGEAALTMIFELPAGVARPPEASPADPDAMGSLQ